MVSCSWLWLRCGLHCWWWNLWCYLPLRIQLLLECTSHLLNTILHPLFEVAKWVGLRVWVTVKMCDFGMGRNRLCWPETFFVHLLIILCKQCVKCDYKNDVFKDSLIVRINWFRKYWKHIWEFEQLPTLWPIWPVSVLAMFYFYFYLL